MHPIPSSQSAEHIADNLAVSGFTWSLSEAELAALKRLDRGERSFPKPNLVGEQSVME